MNTFIVLICGLNIRAHNRMPLSAQLRLLAADSNLLSIDYAGDKGSYRVGTNLDAAGTIKVTSAALQAQCPTITQAAISTPLIIRDALEVLVTVLTHQYGDQFDRKSFGISINGEEWRAGLALPLFPGILPGGNLPVHKTKNAIILGASHGAVLLAKKETHNVHWGTSVTDPSERLIRRTFGMRLSLTSRSANILRQLVV